MYYSCGFSSNHLKIHKPFLATRPYGSGTRRIWPVRSLLVPYLAHWQTDSHKEDSVLNKEGIQSWTGWHMSVISTFWRLKQELNFREAPAI